MRTRTRRDLAGRLVGAAAALIALATAATTHAQTPFFPYHGKNQIRYDNFRWYTYTTDHFEIYYYPETEQHLERIAGYAESAYQAISADLKHDLAFKVPLIIFKTSSEFLSTSLETWTRTPFKTFIVRLKQVLLRLSFGTPISRRQK